MSDTQSNGQDQAGPTSLPMNVLAQYVKDLSFENPNAPQSLMPNQAQPQVNIGVDVQVRPVGEDVYEVVLQLRAEAKQGESVAFLAELAYAGLFQLPGLPQEHHRPVLMIEAPRMLFPFARAIISDATRDGGFPPLMINPIDFADLFRRQMAAQAQQNQGGQAPQGQPPF
ncbi:protein-export chaperone SecB [Azospirillum sp. SYSU D00513]|uniref:protein-export chaperone SecB n=1 Tax=Azospirillum sp. SYSU D00513 TaxID=2812561 RepID=UPI001A9671ED|nr:protein-export chaperone SecB [Azospirillum sp. SYSU D00513]